MRTEHIAALIWRFAGMILVLFPLFTFLHYFIYRGGDESLILSFFLVPIGACLILFSKQLGALMSKGL